MESQRAPGQVETGMSKWKMKIEECYAQMGADYTAVLGRLQSAALIQKFMLLFPKDPTYQELKQAIADQNGEDAFRAAHTLKGVCLNLGFTSLYKVSAELTEVLRGRETEGSDELYEQVKEQYTILTEAIQELAAQS